MEKLRQGKTPTLVVEELAVEGVVTSAENVQKEASLARKRGEPIPKFNTARRMQIESVKGSAKRGLLSEERIKLRNKVAKYILEGLTPADIILSGRSSKADPLEVVSLCTDLSPIRGDGLKLHWLKAENYVSGNAKTLVDAIDELLDHWGNAANELGSTRKLLSQRDGEISTLRNELDKQATVNANLKMDLGRHDDRIRELGSAVSDAREHERRVLNASSYLKSLIAAKGLRRATQLLERAEVPNKLESLIESERLLLAKAKDGVKDAERYAVSKKRMADEYYSDTVEQTTKEIALAKATSRVPDERFDVVTAGVMMLQTDPVYFAEVMRQLPYMGKVNLFANFEYELQAEMIKAMADGGAARIEAELANGIYEIRMATNALRHKW